MRMRMIVTAAAAVLALAACTPRSSGGGNTAQMGAQGNLASAQPTPEQLEANAAAAEAEANRLLAQSGNQAAQGDQGDGQAVGGPAGAIARSLGPSSEKLGSGQYYDTVSFAAQGGETIHLDYQANGFTPVIVILGPDRQVFSQSRAFNSNHLDDDVRPDRAGTWYVLLSATDVGAGGTYTFNMQRVTEHPLN